MRPATTLHVIQGARLTETLQAINFDQTKPTIYLSDDTLTGKIWLIPGAASMILFTPTWVDFAKGLIGVELTELQTAGLAAGVTYNLHVFVTRTGKTYGAAWTYLEVLPAAA